MNAENKGRYEFDVKLYDAGPDGKAKIRSLFNFMQSAADSHSMSLGTSMNIMSENNLTWVYSRFYVEIENSPAMYDTVFCETWRSGITDGMVNREFLLSGEDGSLLLKATSSLALIDRSSRKPVEIPDFIKTQFEAGRGRALHYVPFDIEKTDIFDYIYSMKVRFEDIDVNGHMNNASYAQMFFESYLSGMSEYKRMKKMDILFKGEIHYGDELNCGIKRIKIGQNRFFHRGYNETKKRTSAVAVTEWE